MRRLCSPEELAAEAPWEQSWAGDWSPGVWPITGPGARAEAAPALIVKDSGLLLGGTKFLSTCRRQGTSTTGAQAAAADRLRCSEICVLGLPQRSVRGFLEAHVAHLL